MPKYGNFENRPVSRKPMPVEQKEAQFRPQGVEIELIFAIRAVVSEIRAEFQNGHIWA